MSDPIDPKLAPGMAAMWDNVSAANKSMRAFASEMQEMSKESIESATKLMEKLRSAKTVEEVVSIQTSFMQQSFATYADTTRKMSEMMMAIPMEFAKQSQMAMKQGTDAVAKATKQGGEALHQSHD